MQAARKSIEEVIANPAYSFWLKEALKTSLARDCVDAVRDAELLHRLLLAVARETLDDKHHFSGSN